MSTQDFATLDPGLPLALLPVRLEARYLPRGNPEELVVRIFPDDLHADGHEPALTARERDAAMTYWQQVWEQDDTTVVAAARQWLATICGPYRALWVATAMTPVGVVGADLQFPETPEQLGRGPVMARLLPDRWMVRLYDAQLDLAHTEFSVKRTGDLAIAPTLGTPDTEPPDATDDPLDALLHGQGLDWAIDVGAAVEAGMAVRIPIGAVPSPVGAVLVTGVRAGREAEAEAAELDALLRAHWYTDGCDVVPQGTPTNNTDAGRSGVSVGAPDVDELFDRETSTRPAAPAMRTAALAADPAMLYRLLAADSLSLAVGRLRTNTFDRVAHAEEPDGPLAWAINVAIGTAALGGYFAGPLSKESGRGLVEDIGPELRDWYVDWVRGAGPLPALRCGAQPYGVLPIISAPDPDAPGDDFAAVLERSVRAVTTAWTASLPSSALDPDATDARPGGTPAADADVVGEVLGAVPHPVSLQLRTATDHTEADRAAFDAAIASIDDYLNRDQAGLPWAETVQAWRDAMPGITGPPVPDIHTQLERVEEFREVLDANVGEQGFFYGEEALAVVDDELLPLLQMHRDATDAVPSQLDGWNGEGGVGSDNVIRLVHTTFSPSAGPVGRLVTSDGDVEELNDLLDRFDAGLEAIAAGGIDPPARTRVVTGEAPLLHHLVDQTVLSVPLDQVDAVRAALAVLRAFAGQGREDTEAVVERMLRAALGLGVHRVDAWISSRASARLAELRRANPIGLQIGAYGWLLDLSPSDDPTSQGFVHATSMSHAATAAVLRSGWSAFGTASGDAPLSIDLSSARVRGAEWILDAVRNGQDLAEALGARFERALHDAFVDDWIDDIRARVLVAAGRPGPPSAVVDGLLLARAGSDVELTPAEQALQDDLRAATRPDGIDPAADARRRRVRTAWTALGDDLDAVADLTMAQSVHALLRNNLEAASAALALTGGGDANVPPMSVTTTAAEPQLVSHRVVVPFPADVGARSEVVSPLAAAEPRLDAWLASLLPPTEHVSAVAVVHDATGAEIARHAVTLASTGLTSVEAALLAGRNVDQTGSPLGRVLRATAAPLAEAGQSVAVHLDQAGPPDGPSSRHAVWSVDEFGLVAVAATDAIGHSRPLRGADLVVPGGDPSSAVDDVAELDARSIDLDTTLDIIEGGLASRDAAQQRRALGRLAAIGVSGALAALDGGDPAVVAAALAERRSAAHRLRGVERLTALTGGRLPILPVFTPVPDDGIAKSATYQPRLDVVADSGHRWLRQVGRVRRAVGSVDALLMFAESMQERAISDLAVVQLPHNEESWAAVTKPVGQHERLCVFSLSGADALANGEPIAGLYIDGWTEGIPRQDQLTGIAVHFDAPTARAPQAVLMSVVAEGRSFGADELCGQLLHTLRLAKLRSIPPTSIVEHGHYLPTVFLPDDASVM